MLNKKITFIVFCFLFLFLSVYFYQIPIVVSNSRLLFILVLVFISYTFFYITKENNEKITNQYLSLTRLFLLSYTIVFFQNYVDIVLGLTDWDHYLSVAYSRVVCKSAVLSLSGFVCFCLGYLLRKDYIDKSMFKIEFTSLGVLKIITLMMFIAFILSIDDGYLKGGYGEVEQTATSGFITYLLESLLYSVIILYSINCSSMNKDDKSIFSYIKGLGWFNIILGFYLLSVLISGDREPIINFILAYLFSYVYFSKITFSKKKILMFVALGGFMITLLGIARNVTSSKGNKMEQMNIALQMVGVKEKTSFFLPTKELANSVRTLHAVVHESELEGYTHTYGKYQSYQILSSLPFMGTILTNLGVYSKGSLMSSGHITWLLQGDNPRYGDGTSCNADLFLDFGYFGVCISLLIFGYFCRKVDLAFVSDSNSSLFFYIIMVIYFSQAVGMPRSVILFPLKKSIMIYVICVLYKSFNKQILIYFKR